MKGYFLKHGTLTLNQKWILGKEIDDTGLVELPVWSFLVKHEKGLILFDTGVNVCEPGLINNFFWHAKEGCYRESKEESIAMRFEALGLDMADVTHVVISHLHSDHDGNIHLFPNAKVYVSSKEFIGTMRSYGIGNAREDLISKIEYWAHNKQNWCLVEEDRVEILPGITLFQYGSGHHHGMLCAQIDFDNYGSVFMAADAIYTSINIGPPMSVPGGVMDREGYIKTQNAIMAYTSQENIELWCGHDALFIEQLIEKTNGYFD